MTVPLPEAIPTIVSTTTNPPASTITFANPPAAFTAEDMARAREEEKAKLFDRLDKAAQRVSAVETELAAQAREREERKAAKTAKAEAKEQEKAAKAKAKGEAEMSARKLLQTKTAEFEARFQSMEEQRSMREAVLEKEAEFARLRAYIQERVTQEQDAIAPQLLDFITGDSREEVDASVERVKAKTQEILQGVQNAQTNARAQMRGTAPTGFTAAGPMDNEGNQQTLTQEQLKAMPMSRFAALRPQLLGAAANATNRGLFD